HQGSSGLPRPGNPALAAGAPAPQPENPDQLGANGPDRHSVAAARPRNASLPRGALCRHTPKVGAQYGNPARWDLCGGPPARAVPTATRTGLLDGGVETVGVAVHVARVEVAVQVQCGGDAGVSHDLLEHLGRVSGLDHE